MLEFRNHSYAAFLFDMDGTLDPQGFQLAAQRLGVRIDECLVFEDSPAGVAAAKAAGADVAIVGRRVPKSEGAFVLANYSV